MAREQEPDPQGVEHLKEGINDDYRRLQAARASGQLTLELAIEGSMNDRLDDLSELMPNIVRGDE